MLKWAVTPRINNEFYEHDGMNNNDQYNLLTLQSIIEQQQLPCLVRLINDDRNDSIDNYCLLLCQINDPYLIVSNETERFSIPISFDGLFASVEHGITRYNILQSFRSLQSHLKSPSSTSSLSEFTQFTTLEPCIAYSNSTLHHIHPGTLIEPCYKSYRSSPSPCPSSSSMTSNRLRTLIANFPQTLNKHFLSNQQQSRLIKKPISSNDCFDIKTNLHEEILTFKSDSSGLFVPIYKQLPLLNPKYHSSKHIYGLYTTHLLSQLTNQYPLITELIISRTLEENLPSINEYPFRRITLHRFVENHSRIIAFDMKNYTFIEIDATNSLDMYAIEHDKTLFHRYQAQLRWCHEHLSSFRSQIKTIIHSSNGTPMFIQATPFHGQQYPQRRCSSSALSSPLIKHIPHTIFTSQESISSNRLRSNIPLLSKFYTTSNHLKYEQKRNKGKTTGSNLLSRKDVRVYFNDPTIQKHLIFNKKNTNYRLNKTDNEINIGDDENDNSFQCTAL